MKYYILIDNSNVERNNNVLVMENILSKGINKLFEGRTDKTKQTIDDVINLINGHKSVLKYHIEYLYLDEDEISIPMSSNALLMLKNGEPDRFFGDYINYVLSLYAEDLNVANKSDVSNLFYESSNQPKVVVDVETKDKMEYINLTAIQIQTKYFD